MQGRLMLEKFWFQGHMQAICLDLSETQKRSRQILYDRPRKERITEQRYVSIVLTYILLFTHKVCSKLYVQGKLFFLDQHKLLRTSRYIVICLEWNQNDALYFCLKILMIHIYHSLNSGIVFIDFTFIQYRICICLVYTQVLV